EIAQGLFPRLPEPQLPEHHGQLVAERSLAPLLHHLADGGGEIEARLDREREEIEIVREGADDLVLPRLAAVAQPEDRIERAEDRRGRNDERRALQPCDEQRAER